MATAVDPNIIVIGDVHGCLEELKQLLNKCGYRKGIDRVILVGDLVGKGPFSVETVQYVKDNNFECLRGNHEEFIFEWHTAVLSGKQPPPIKSPTHADAANRLSESEWAWLKSMPYIISIPKSLHGVPHSASASSGSTPLQTPQDVVIVHAGLVPNVPHHKQDPEAMTNMRNLVLTSSGEWQWKSSTDQGEPWAKVWHGPEHIVFGHDAVRGLQLYPHATGLDTGCCYGVALTALVLPRAELVSVAAAAVYSPPGKKIEYGDKIDYTKSVPPTPEAAGATSKQPESGKAWWQFWK